VPGKYLWFSYLKNLKDRFRGNGFSFRGEFINMSPTYRQASVQRLTDFLLHLTPHPSAMYEIIEQELPRLEDFASPQFLRDYCAGMADEQIEELASHPLFSFGVHTADHPFLTRCDAEESARQLLTNKHWLERVTKKPCDILAYPAGDYNAAILQQACELGFTRGYAVIPHVKSELSMQIPRVGIYSTCIDVLGFKVQWGNWLRTWGASFG
jgi:peptidoglycan/xylan/chitin deacetylase (PgdA/CDA1 family)